MIVMMMTAVVSGLVLEPLKKDTVVRDLVQTIYTEQMER